VILPGDREALFARQNDKPLAVKPGGQVDGWTVKDIENDRVILTSAFGQRVLEPSKGLPGEGVNPVPPHRVVRAHKSNSQRPPSGAVPPPARLVPGMGVPNPLMPIPRPVQPAGMQQPGMQQPAHGRH
jgi:hypothetical protein